MRNRNVRSMLGASACLAALALAGAAFADAPPPDLPAPMPPAANQKLAHDIFKDLVEVRSVHSIGTKGTADVIVKYLKANGFSDSDILVLPETQNPHQVNVVVRIKGNGTSKEKPVMWICHMDVVDARPEDWTLPPYKFTEKDGWFYGRGTSDMKDEDAAVAASIIRLRKEGYVPDRDIIAAFTADEEVGEEEDGPAFLLKAHPDAVNAGVVINPDGGSGEIQNGKRLDFTIETSEKTYVTYTMTATNRGGHSSEPRPDNAIYELADGLVKLQHYQFPFKTNATTRLYFKDIAGRQKGQTRADMMKLASSPKVDLAAATRLAKDVSMNAILHSTCVATMLNAGVQENALPARAVATIQCRIMPDETIEGTKATLEKVVDDPGVRIETLGMVTQAGESAPTPEILSRLTKTVDSMWPGAPVVPVMSAGASDSIFTRNAGIPSYGIGGGWNDINDIRMHGRDERMGQEDFYQTVEFTYRLMKELTGGTPADAVATGAK
jgi:acetylornithine deacetylase/succinyl-diaminopimelate desuccinylase-like protein